MFKRLPLALPIMIACSSSESDGIGPDPSGGATTGGQDASSTSSAASGGSGGGTPFQNFASNLAFVALQGEFDSAEQEPVGGEPVPPKGMVGCAVEAPELGERVVYVERYDLDAPDTPDRQLLLALEGVESGIGGIFAKGRLLAIFAPDAWAGRCQVGTAMPLLSDVEEVSECVVNLARNGGSVTLSSNEQALPTTCLSAPLQAEGIAPEMSILATMVRWSDQVFLEGGDVVRDPANPEPGGYAFYELTRRTARPPMPGEK